MDDSPSPMTRAGQAVLAVALTIGFWHLVLSGALHMPHIHLSFFDGMEPNNVMVIVCGVLFAIGCVITLMVSAHNARVEEARVARRDAHLAELRRQKEEPAESIA